MTQFKDKSQGTPKTSTPGFNYPALMAADILATMWNRAGADQKQHLS